jgi:hypothetical protein
MFSRNSSLSLSTFDSTSWADWIDAPAATHFVRPSQTAKKSSDELEMWRLSDCSSKQKREEQMKPDSMLVEPEHIVSARQEVAEKGSAQALNEFAQAEPALGSFIYEGLAVVAGKLSLSGAPTELVQGSHEDVLAVLLTCMQAMRRGHYTLWKDAMAETRWAQIEPSLKAKSKPRRKKSKNSVEHSDPAGNSPISPES